MRVYQGEIVEMPSSISTQFIMPHQKIFSIIFIFSTCVFLNACNNDRCKVDISTVDVSFSILRLEYDMFRPEQDSIADQILFLHNKYDDFFDLYNAKIINIGGINDVRYSEFLNLFIATYSDLFDTVMRIFPTMTDVDENLSEAFRYYKYHFPRKNVPTVYSYISGFNQSIVTTEDKLGIGLDKYLGRNCTYYTRLGLPVYKCAKMEKNRIPFDCMQAWAEMEFEYNDSIDNLISQMIHKGKILYFLDAMFPASPDSMKIGYSSLHMTWCKNSEKHMWAFLIDNKVLFTTDYLTITRYVDDAPFTSTFSHDSPSRTGIWMGWQIVRQYMDNNADLSLQELMNETDYLKILYQSEYNP